MVAHATTPNSPDAARLRSVVVRLAITVTQVAVGMSLLLACWLLFRRFGGGLQKPLGAPALLVVAIACVAVASWLRVVWHYTGLRMSHWKSWPVLVWGIPSVIVVLLGLALTIKGTGSGALVCFWSILVLAETLWWWSAWRQWKSAQMPTLASGVEQGNALPGGIELQHAPAEVGSNASSEDSLEAGADVEHLDSVPSGSCDDEAGENDCDEPLPDEVSQQITRAFAGKENDTVTGLLRAQFAPGERSRSLHVAFCPPMLRRPEVTTIQLSGPRARIKIAEYQPFGVRFDVRLVRADQEEQDLLLHFEARCGERESPVLESS